MLFKIKKVIVQIFFIFLAVDMVFISGVSAATIYVSNYGDGTCSYANVNAAIADATNGDIVNVPAGNCTWTTASGVNVNKQITLRGNGIDSTIITTSGSSFQPVVHIAAANATVRDFTFISTDGSKAYPVQATAAASNFRIAHNKFTGTSGYAIDVRTAYGVIDHNSITFTSGSSQPINVRGPSDSWQTESTIGGADNVFMEDNVFTSDNLGYPVCSTNARCVFRYNIIGPTKIDMHGTCTGNPGVRHYEIYNNTWNDHYGYYRAFDIRGGTGRIFDNTATHTSPSATGLWFTLDEHAANHTYCAGYIPNCCCTAPCDEQIGVGKDPKSRASEPLYIWGNTRNGSYWPASVQSDVSLCATSEQCGTDFKMTDIITSGIDFFNSETKPAAMSGYTPYIYPHPLTNPSPPQNLRIAP